MKKILLLLAIQFFNIFIFAQPFHSSLEPSEKEIVVYVGSYDWGACIDKIVINTERPFSPQSIRAKDFEVTRILYPKSTNIGVSKGSLSVTDAFCSDSQGNRIHSPSKFITILTDVHPEAEKSSPFVSISVGGTFKDYYGYKVENDELDIKVKKFKGFVNKNASKFQANNFEYEFPSTEEQKEEKLNLTYLDYVPKTASESKKVPLILWFHGIAEGGSNPYKILFGTKASELAGERIQSYFNEGVAILAPLCPTAWLESDQKGLGGARYWTPVDKDSAVDKVKKPIEKFLSNIFVTEEKKQQPKIPFAAVSYYSEPVKNLLYSYLEQHPEIDQNRIYVGGCSAGGYMTINMLLKYPRIFAAGFPICEYYLDSKITDEQIKLLAEKPLWFTYSLDDDTVNPKKTSVPTIERLKEAGAKNLHSSQFRSVVDLSGKYLKKREAKKNDEDYGLPYEYSGHSVWIYVMNDECNEGKLPMFKWLNNQKL